MREGQQGESHLPSNAPWALEEPRLLAPGFQAPGGGGAALPHPELQQAEVPGPRGQAPLVRNHSRTESGLFGLDCPGHVPALWPQSPRWASASELSDGISDDLVSTCRCKELSSFQDAREE